MLLCILNGFALVAVEQSNLHAAQEPVDILEFDQDLSLWNLTSGYLYLYDSCDDISAQTTAYLWRRAINYSHIAELQTITGTPQCRTFRHAATDESGIYYYNRNLGRIEAIYSDRPDDPPTVLATIGDWDRIGFGGGAGISQLRLYGSAIYWIEVIRHGEFDPDDITIKQLSKSGGVPKTMITYSTAGQASLEGLGVTSAYIWWTDSDGLNRTSSCILQPCSPGPATKTVEFPISSSLGHIEITGSSLLWWNGGDNPETIRRTSCSRFSGTCSTSTVHFISSSARIAGLAASSTAVFWVEHDTFAGTRLRRKALSGGTAETLAEDVSERAPYLGDYGIHFQNGARTISRLFENASPITHEFGIKGWEVTQGIQRPANDVPLVAGKTTYVRLYPELQDGEDAGAVGARIFGTRDGQALPGSPIYPLNNNIPVSSSSSLADRADVDGGWLFRLPESWTRTGNDLIPQSDTTITLRAVIDPYGAYAESDSPSNNEKQGDFLFTAKAPVCMTMRPVTTHDAYQSVHDINIGQMVELTESALPTTRLIAFPKNDPLREIDWCWKNLVYGPFCSTPYELKDDDSQLLTKMGWIDFWADTPSICLSNNARTLFAGIIHEDTEWDWGGLARRGKDQMLTKVPAYGKLISRKNGLAMTMVHEIGHNFDRLHVDCGKDVLSVDSNYPYPTDRLDEALSSDNSALHFGFDPLQQKAVDPGTNKDYMSYCDDSWASDYTWKALFNKLRDPIFVPPTLLERTAGEGDILRVAGVIDSGSNAGSLDTAFTLPANQTSDRQLQKVLGTQIQSKVAAPGAPNYHLQIIGTGAQLLADHPIELNPVEDGDPAAPLPFEMTIAAPAGIAAHLHLMQDDQILASLSPGTAHPAISLSQPAGGTLVGSDIVVDWTASDADGDQLFYTIQYSPDGGGQWVPLLVNYGGSGAASELLTLDLSSEAGSDGEVALIRVIASDGFNTGIAVSQPFSVVKRDPVVAITHPAEDQVFAASDLVLLHGFATDAEDGLIADNQFFWSTGQTGQTTEISGLAPGNHTIQLTVMDADGLDGAHSVSFDVAPLGVPKISTGFTLDGGCDDVGYLNATQLPLSKYAGGARASAKIIHTASYLWLCVSGLEDVAGTFGMLLDANNSGEAKLKSGDYGFFVQPDGTRYVLEGDGGGFSEAPDGDFSARIFEHDSAWTAELRIRRNAFGSFQKRVALALGHFDPGDNEIAVWPRTAERTNPQSWAQTNLGLIGVLTAVEPTSAVLGAGDVSLTVSGANFDSSHRVMWNSATMTTTFVDSNTLTAVVPSGLVTTAGIQGVSVGMVSVADLVTAALPFTVTNPQPAITSLTPNTARAQSPGMVVSINGLDFVDSAVVIWNGEARPTSFISSEQLQIELTDDELTAARSVPVVVINPEPAAGPSDPTHFQITELLDEVFADGFE